MRPSGLIMAPSASWEVGCYCVCCKSWLPLFYMKHWDAQKLTWRKTLQKDEATPQKEEATASKIEETTAQKKNNEWAVVSLACSPGAVRLGPVRLGPVGPVGLA